jgi:hypothetical protein
VKTALLAVGLGAVLLALALGSAAGAAAGSGTVNATLSGTCLLKTKLDTNGVVTSSTITCEARGACACDGATRLVYQDTASAPGNGAPGHMKGTLTATGPGSSVTLALVGTGTSGGLDTGSVGLVKGAWSLGKVTGLVLSRLVRGGSYTTKTTTLNPITGTTSYTVRVAAAIGCWNCSPAS